MNDLDTKPKTIKHTITTSNLSILLFFIALLSSCSTTKNTVYWVNSSKSDCVSGAGKMQCLSVSKEESLEKAEWNNFFSNIKGFSFEPGYFQKIEIKEEHLDKNKVPADASFIKYTLIKVIEKKKDYRIAIHDIWAVKSIYGIPIEKETPSLEINISKMEVFGSDGCNHFHGKIKQLDIQNIVFFSLTTTRKICLDMTIPDRFNKALANSVGYIKKGLILSFKDKNGNETLVLKKVD
tara:strand:+ start:13288 stop:13998 length:711 start_codon:yes stop_codon:yes gene_type:complete